MAKQLTPKQKLFVEEYLVDLNATQAAIRAGYKNPDIGRQLITKNNVQEKIQERMHDREIRTEITQDKVLKELAAIAFSNGSDFAKVITKTGKNKRGEEIEYQDVELELTDRLPPEKKKAIAGIKMGKNGIEVSTCDKVKALELLGRHLGMWNDKLQVENQAEEEKVKKLDNIESILEQMKPIENEKT